MHRDGLTLRMAMATGLGVLLAGCGQSDFHEMIVARCGERQADSGTDCGCIADRYEAGLSERVKVAFPALRWPLQPDPADRETVNNGLMRAAGVDPADPQAVASLRSEYKDSYNVLRQEVQNACGGSI